MERDLVSLWSTAREVAAAACELLAGASDSVGAVRHKANAKDLVTEWDLRSEALIRSELGRRTPEIPILAEEGGVSGDDTTSGDWWLVDPIDGTYNFAHGLPLFAVSIALERDGEPVVGVVAAPDLGWEFHAALGHGAFEKDRRLAVSGTTALSDAMLASGFPPDRAQTSWNFAEWEDLQRRAGACRRLGAAALDLCLVARGWLDGYWETRLNPWDLAAGAIIVREAGGMVTDITGSTFRLRSGNAIASNGAIHKEIVGRLEAVGGVIHNPGKDRAQP